MNASLGIAGVNTRPLLSACLGVAGNWGSTLRPHVSRVLDASPESGKRRLGDVASREAWRKAIFFVDYTMVTTPDRRTRRMRWRPAFPEMMDAERRKLPVYLDSAAFRVFEGSAPPWASYERYCEAIDLVQPTGAMALDVIGDNAASQEGYRRMVRDGYGAVVIPVWQARAGYDPTQTPIQNARTAAKDPILRAYVDSAPLVGIGGLAKGKHSKSPIERDHRAAYLAELCRQLPGAHLWALGQASPKVLNGLNREGVLDRVWTDSSWWIHSAKAERLAILSRGELTEIRFDALYQTYSFATLVENMAMNLRGILSAYAGLTSWPPPDPVPSDLTDPDAHAELRRRLQSEQLDIWNLLTPPSDTSEEAGS